MGKKRPLMARPLKSNGSIFFSLSRDFSSGVTDRRCKGTKTQSSIAINVIVSSESLPSIPTIETINHLHASCMYSIQCECPYMKQLSRNMANSGSQELQCDHPPPLLPIAQDCRLSMLTIIVVFLRFLAMS